MKKEKNKKITRKKKNFKGFNLLKKILINIRKQVGLKNFYLFKVR